MKTEVPAQFPDLRIEIEDGGVVIRGNFPVVDGAEIIDRFLIEIALPRDYPESAPILREVGGRIPWHQDRHVNPGNGEACPIVPEEWLMRPDYGSILSFLHGPVRNFFLGQILVESGQSWPFGERTHGGQGLLEAYGEIVGTTDRNVLLRHLDYLSKEVIKGHWDCPCGSEKRLRNCHWDEVKSLHEKIPPRVAQKALQRLAIFSIRP